MATADPTLETPWDSQQEADAAVSNYFSEDGQAPNGGCPDGYVYDAQQDACVEEYVEPEPGASGDDGCPPDYEYDPSLNACVFVGEEGAEENPYVDAFGESGTLSGSINAPDTLVTGAAQEISATITNSGDGAEEGQFVLAITDGQGDGYRLDSISTAIQPGETVTADYVVPQGSIQNAPGPAELVVVGFVTNGSGVVASKDVTVADAHSDETAEEQMGGWSTPYFIQELPYGWNLYGQDHEKKGTRYIVAAKDSGGNTIYLTKSGGISDTPVYFTNPDDIVAALEAFAQKAENGEFEEGTLPDQSQPRPSPEELTQDIINGGGGLAGLLGAVGGANGAAVVLLLGVFLARRYGKISSKQTRLAAVGIGVGWAAVRFRGGGA